jgi:malate dehydrogenase (oxaloacetate-decarboxylating)
MELDLSLKNLAEALPADLSQDQRARAQTLFLKRLSLAAHEFFGGKMQTMPKCGLWGFNWFNVWYTPGVSQVSTTIRDDNDRSFALSNRGNLVAIVSDSTRVLGDGDCTPPGGLGVMEGKAFLMKYLGGVDATALCIDSRGKDGKHDPNKIIEFVKMAAPSFGAVNLEDISQPNCFKVLDELREACDIPVWHDDAQGTACITLAGLVNALKLAGKKLGDVRIVLLGAGAANTTIARLIISDGGDPAKIVLFDSKGSLHAGRSDIEADPREYRKWELCRTTNPKRVATEAEALAGADVLIALSKPGPDTVKRPWIRSMAEKSIVFACANPVPEIWPYAAKEEGAYIVATGRGDFDLLPRPLERGPPRARAQDHRRDGHTLCALDRRLRREARYHGGQHNRHDGGDRRLRSRGRRRGRPGRGRGRRAREALVGRSLRACQGGHRRRAQRDRGHAAAGACGHAARIDAQRFPRLGRRAGQMSAAHVR